MPVYESDICIIGGGVSAAMLAQKLTELRPHASITVVEAGRSIFDFENRMKYRQRQMEYGENPWHEDFIPDQAAEGQISRSMAVGGQALHWGGACNRFSVEDLRLKSMYGLYTDWPLEWDDLERHYCEAERRLGVSGDPSLYSADKMTQPYPMPGMILSHDIAQMKQWGNQSGILFQGIPQSKNTVPYDGRNACLRCGTCDICPTGAKYSPDFTFKRLLANKKITLHDHTLVRKLTLNEGNDRIASAEAVHRDHPDDPVQYRAGTFVLAGGYTWSPHLLLLSTSPRFPNGLANKTGQVGKYSTGHAFITAYIEIERDVTPGMNPQYGLISREFFRCPTDRPYVRHDLRIWPSNGPRPRLKNDSGEFLLGEDVLTDWRARNKKSVARVRGYFDIHPDENSALTLDPTHRNSLGDPMPKIIHKMDKATEARWPATKQHMNEVFARLAKADNGKILRTSESDYLDHPAGGCRMGTDPATSVCDSFGRTHDHENLYVVGAPTLPSAGCTNGTLTFVALTLRSATAIANQLPASQRS
ncbi:GMC family oxidoreductase [Granulicella sp. WH15]|uniref:GMC oxidoreductase n=1 Tax=Granulicella sp. WH15 TaxID=2602070 RepID=UPI001366E591|nr:GMC family oxidoreductase [Granulicella sp. WH15]QHN05130.1 GMC family oxidoreductase [Granulicella sp. WH15]